jgi:uncharacterized membrane protein (Fun14 family)
MVSQIKSWIFIECIATVTLIAGVALTSFNIYPLNVYVSTIGNGLWLAIAFHWQKKSLITIQVFVIGIYIMGMGKHLIEGI